MPTASAIAAAVAAINKAPATNAASALAAVQDTVFTIEVDLHNDSITVPFAPSSMTLSDLIKDLVVAE